MKALDSLFNAKPSVLDSQTVPVYAAPLSRGDFDTAAPLLLAAVTKGDAHAMGIYAAMQALGRGVEKNSQEAYCWFLQGATRGDMNSQIALGMCLAVGMGTTVDRKEPFKPEHRFRQFSSGTLRCLPLSDGLAPSRTEDCAPTRREA